MSFYSNTPILFGGISGVTATPGSKDPELGSRINYGGNEYVYVYNAGNSQISPGYAVVPASGATGWSGTVSSIGLVDTVYGVVKHATLTTGTYGWVLAKGFASVVASSTVAAGDYMAIGADGKCVTAVTYPGFAKIMSATVTGASGGAYICAK